MAYIVPMHVKPKFTYLFTLTFLFLLRLLEQELQRVMRKAEMKEKDLRQHIDELRQDNERQQKLIGQVSDPVLPVAGWSCDPCMLNCWMPVNDLEAISV